VRVNSDCEGQRTNERTGFYCVWLGIHHQYSSPAIARKSINSDHKGLHSVIVSKLHMEKNEKTLRLSNETKTERETKQSDQIVKSRHHYENRAQNCSIAHPKVKADYWSMTDKKH